MSSAPSQVGQTLHHSEGTSGGQVISSDFLRNVLGGWDNVRFGADSEIIERSKIILGEEFMRFQLVAMLCTISENGLTSQADHFIDDRAGPSEKPREYARSYRNWHDKYRSQPNCFPRMQFFKSSDLRYFPAPETFLPSAVSICRNVCSIVGNLQPEQQKVSVLCVSRRPEFLPLVAAMLEHQTHRDFELIFVAHGDGFGVAVDERWFENLPSFRVIRAREGTKFGTAFNLGLHACSADIVMKMDDDDFYGPAYIRNSLAVLQNAERDDVGVVGKGRAYVYVSSMGLLGIRFPERNENCIRSHVFGSTLFWSRTKTKLQSFRELDRGIDVAFIEDVRSNGCQIYSGSRFDYIAFRHSGHNHHTWQISDQEFVKSVTPVGNRLDLALACSSFDREVVGILQRKFDAMIGSLSQGAEDNECRIC